MPTELPNVEHQANFSVHIGNITVVLAPYRTLFLRFDFAPGEFDATVWQHAILNYFWFYLGEAATQVTSESLVLYSAPPATSVVAVVQLPSVSLAAQLRNVVRDATIIIEFDGRSHIGTVLRLVQTDRGLSVAGSGLLPAGVTVLDVDAGSKAPKPAAPTPVLTTAMGVMLAITVPALLVFAIFWNSRAHRRQQAKKGRSKAGDSEASSVFDTEMLHAWDGHHATNTGPTSEPINVSQHGSMSQGATTTDRSRTGLATRMETTDTCTEEEEMWDKTDSMRRRFIEHRYDATDATPAQRTNPLWQASASIGSDAMLTPNSPALDTRVAKGPRISAVDVIEVPTSDVDGYLWNQTGDIADSDVAADSIMDAFQHLKDMFEPTFPISVVPGTQHVFIAPYSIVDDASATDSVVDSPSHPTDADAPVEAVYDNHGNGSVNIGKDYHVPEDFTDVDADSVVDVETSSACGACAGADAYTRPLAASDCDSEASVPSGSGVELLPKLAESVADFDHGSAVYSARYDADSDEEGSTIYSARYDAGVGISPEPAESVVESEGNAYSVLHGAGVGAYVGESVADSDDGGSVYSIPHCAGVGAYVGPLAESFVDSDDGGPGDSGTMYSVPHNAGVGAYVGMLAERDDSDASTTFYSAPTRPNGHEDTASSLGAASGV